jgi:hypothetical protein
MPNFESFKNFSQGMMYWFIIAVIVLLGIWLVISGVGNFVNARNQTAEPPDTIYAVGIHATGQVLYTDKYEVTTSPHDTSLKQYTMYEYYELVKNKYQKRDNVLSLDEYYFGEIEVRKRR